MTTDTANSTPRERAKAALQSLFIGDALAMPVHWFYRPMDILRQFPPQGIDKMYPAPRSHPTSIMSLHSTARGGRGDQHADDIVGTVILKGKSRFWNVDRMHYHQGLEAGDNTLNAWCARLMMNFMTQHSEYDRDSWLDRYVAFMTADPAEHPDTYAESYHRGFFANMVAGKPAAECGAVTHDTPSMGGLVTVAPLALALLPRLPLKQVQGICREHVRATHPDQTLMRVVDSYVSLMAALINRDGTDADVQEHFVKAASVVSGGNIERFLSGKRSDAEVVGGHYSLACYITDSWPSVCYLAARYCGDSARGLLVNANLGGENAHRGSVLGTLVSLASGSAPAGLFGQLKHAGQLDAEIDRWCHKFYP